MALLALEQVKKRLNGKWALWDVCLEINAGEILGILGRSGSGKSMLAAVLAGLDDPTSGSIAVGGSGGEPASAVVAFEQPMAAPELTVYENLDMFAALWGVPRKKRVKQIAFFLELLKLSDQRTLRASLLSMGALKRLEIARALIADAAVTVIDSLLDTLDYDVHESLWEHILDLRRDAMKSIVILTSSGRVAETCQRLAVMEKGRIAFLGRPDDFRKLAGEDMVVLGDIGNPLTRNRIREQFSVVIQEEDGFLSFRVGNGERAVSSLLAEFGSEIGCVYLKRPTLEDALNVLASGGSNVFAANEERKAG